MSLAMTDNRRPGDSDEPYVDGHRFDRDAGRIEAGSGADAARSEDDDTADEADGPSQAEDAPEPESAGEQRS